MHAMRCDVMQARLLQCEAFDEWHYMSSQGDKARTPHRPAIALQHLTIEPVIKSVRATGGLWDNPQASLGVAT